MSQPCATICIQVPILDIQAPIHIRRTALADYRGVAWYWRPFDLPASAAPASWGECTVRMEFEAVFHTATVWVNGHPAGEHARKGYTAFTLDITNLLQSGQTNAIAVRVDN